MAKKCETMNVFWFHVKISFIFIIIEKCFFFVKRRKNNFHITIVIYNPFYASHPTFRAGNMFMS